MGIAEITASVVITVKNEGMNLPLLLDALTKETGEFEIIIVDSESDDETRTIMDKICREKANIKYIRQRCSRGQGRNIGVRASHGKYIIFTDGDAIPQNDWIRKMASALDDCDLVAGKTVSMEGKGTSNLPRVALYFKGFEITLPSMNLGIKKSLFEKLGGFDESFVTAEDIDLNLRAIQNGAKWDICEECIVRHRSRNGMLAIMKQAFWNGYGRRQLRMKNVKVWNQIEMGKITTHLMSPILILRNMVGLAGYIYCNFRKIDFSKQ